jgi:hypothetical protein
MGWKHGRRGSRPRARLVRTIVFRTIVSTAVLLGALYAGLAAGQRIVAYEQRLAQRRFEQSVPACIHSRPLPDGQLAAAHSHQHRAAVLRDCYRPVPRLVQLDAQSSRQHHGMTA